jgi:serine/threonine protein kinase
MKILVKLLNNIKCNEGSDIHDVECASCHIRPIVNVDRYHCLECSIKCSYDLCGRCFENRYVTEKHLNGHPMIHFKLPNEFLGIHINNNDKDINLNKIKQMKTLENEQHDGIKCDGICNKINFIGLCFKCDTCPNYNLCEICALQKHVCTKMHQKDHPLILTSNKVIPKIDSNDIELGDILGRGAFGYVSMANWKSKHRQVACKIIEIDGNSTTSNDLQRSFLLELAAYRELSGPYILRTYAYATRELPANRIHGPKTQFMILMEFMGRGSLQNLLEKEPHKLSLRRKLSMARQIASGMRRIHQHGMIHRDIRPDNILINDDYVAKIGDMGIARVIDPKGQQTQIGCIQFMPPEFFHESSNGYVKCDQKLDIFTYGLTLNQLFTETIHNYKFNSTGSRITINKQSPVFYHHIIFKCLDEDPKQRPTAIEIEKTLQIYEQAFAETMMTDTYTNMNTREKDQVFMRFYQNNHLRIQTFIKEQFPKQLFEEVQIQISHKQPTTVLDEQPIKDHCRIN